jgi:hypothetical protein
MLVSNHQIKYVDLLPQYVIVETLHTGVIGVSKLTINGGSYGGASLNKIFRRVAQVSVEVEYYQQGRQINGIASPWQMIKAYVGYAEFEKRVTGKKSYTLVYAGAQNRAETFGVEFNVPGGGLFAFGSDPIAGIRLAGNPAITFHSENGGQGILRAMAIYDATTGNLAEVPLARGDEIIRSFLNG